MGRVLESHPGTLRRNSAWPARAHNCRILFPLVERRQHKRPLIFRFNVGSARLNLGPETAFPFGGSALRLARPFPCTFLAWPAGRAEAQTALSQPRRSAGEIRARRTMRACEARPAGLAGWQTRGRRQGNFPRVAEPSFNAEQSPYTTGFRRNNDARGQCTICLVTLSLDELGLQSLVSTRGSWSVPSETQLVIC